MPTSSTAYSPTDLIRPQLNYIKDPAHDFSFLSSGIQHNEYVMDIDTFNWVASVIVDFFETAWIPNIRITKENVAKYEQEMVESKSLMTDLDRIILNAIEVKKHESKLGETIRLLKKVKRAMTYQLEFYSFAIHTIKSAFDPKAPTYTLEEVKAHLNEIHRTRRN